MLILAFAAAVSGVLPSIRFCLNSLTCRSVINGTSVPNDYPMTTGKNSRRYRHSLLSLIKPAQVSGQGGGKDQPGIGHQVVVVKGDLDPVQVVA